MAKKPRTETASLFAPRVRGRGGARLDVLLPRDWPQTSAPIIWRYQSRQGETQSGKGALEDLPHVADAMVRLWTPATETLLTQTTLPTTSRSKLAQALPYVLEEQLLDDPGNLHFAWRRESDGTLSVAVTAKERLRTWLADLDRIGMKPTTLCPATLALPWSPDCCTAAFVGDELLVRTGPVSGFTCAGTVEEPPALLVSNVKNQLASTRPPEYFIVLQPPPGFHADVWSAALGIPVRVEPTAFWDVPGDSEPALNLLQGDFTPAGKMSHQWRPWLPAAAMLSLWLVGTVAIDVVEWWQLYRKHDAYRQEMTSLLLSAFPETKTILDPVQQMQRNMETLQARGGMRNYDMLPLLARAGRAWQMPPRVKLRGLRYNERSLTFDISVVDSQALEQFRQNLQSSGLQAETLASNTRGGEFEGRIRIRPPTTVSSVKP